MGVWLHLSAFIPSWDAVWGVSRGTPKYNCQCWSIPKKFLRTHNTECFAVIVDYQNQKLQAKILD